MTINRLKLDWTAGIRALDYDKRDPLKYLTSFDLSRLKTGGKLKGVRFVLILDIRHVRTAPKTGILENFAKVDLIFFFSNRNFHRSVWAWAGTRKN